MDMTELRAWATEYGRIVKDEVVMQKFCDWVERQQVNPLPQPAGITVFQVHEFKVNLIHQTIHRNDKLLELTAKDFKLAVLMLRNIDGLISRVQCIKLHGENHSLRRRELLTLTCHEFVPSSCSIGTTAGC